MKKTDIKSPLLLFLAAFIWGVAFVAQSKAKDYFVEPFTFNAVRNIIGGLTLLPCIFFLGRREPKEKKIEENPKTLLIGGILCATIPPSERPVLSRPCTSCWCQSWEFS